MRATGAGSAIFECSPTSESARQPAARTRRTPRAARGHRRRADQHGHFRLLEKIGEGQFGDVYRAHDPWLDRDVAVKLLKCSGRETSVRASCRKLARWRACATRTW